MREDDDRKTQETDELNKSQPPQEDEWGDKVGQKAQRKLRARQNRQDCVWFGLGAFGVVGWSVAIPTVIGILLGQWIDRTWPSQFSWTLTLLVVGVAAGCANAWYWITRESRQTRCDVDDATSSKERDEEQ